MDDFSPGHRALIEEAAEVWETVISQGVRDIDFGVVPFDSDDHDWFERHNWLGRLIIRDEIVDDVRIYVGRLPDDRPASWEPAAPSMSGRTTFPYWRSSGSTRTPSPAPLKDIAVHEIAHALGFSVAIWYALDLVGPRRPRPPLQRAARAVRLRRRGRMEVRGQEGPPRPRFLSLGASPSSVTR